MSAVVSPSGLINPLDLTDVLAPNGKTVAENFKVWFGGSKVVDAEGKPLVVYHGTDQDITAFALQEDGQSEGFFFAGPESTSYVEGYDNQLDRRPKRTMPVYLSLQNPKTVRASWDEDTFANPDFENEEIAKAKLQGHDGMVFVDPDAGERFFVAFFPEQIKSAIGNSGNYNILSGSLDDKPAPLAPKRRHRP